ncbi:Beta-amyrin 11-oxidase [Bienertia sinuspersici]
MHTKYLSIYLDLGLLLTIVVPLLALLCWWWNEIWYVRAVKAKCLAFNTKVPPGHLGLPFFGETFSFLRFFNKIGRPDDFINSKKIKYGENVGVYRTHLYGSPSIIVCSPALCKLVLNSSDKFKQEWPTTEVLGSNSVITLQGPRHGLIKSFIVNYINRPDPLTRFLVQAQPSIVEALQLWAQKSKVTALPELQKVTLAYTMRYFSGIEAGTQVDKFKSLFEGCRRAITKRLKEELERRKQKSENNNKNGEEIESSDLMDGLMQMKDKEGRQLSEGEVLDNIVSSIHVGHASIAFVMTWSLYFLWKSPHVLQKLQEENMNMSREKNGESLTYEDIMKLKYTNKVIEEIIRRANQSSFVFRKATDDIEFKGYMIPKGWSVMVWVRYLHNDPANFEDPLSFNPDRWDTRPAQGTYLPFGGGPRSCPGSTLVRLSLALFIHHLSIGYSWEVLNPDFKVNYFSHPLPSDGLEISLTKI